MKAYPMAVVCADGAKRIVKDCLEHEKFTGKKWNEDGTPFEEYDPTAPPKPPTLAQVLRQGYTVHSAEQIVQREAMRARLGFKPYGERDSPVVGAWAKLIGGEMRSISAISEDGHKIYVEGVNTPILIEDLEFVPKDQYTPDEELVHEVPSFLRNIKEEGEE